VVVQRIEGVHEAEFSHERGTARVTYDRSMTSPDVFLKELERMTGYEAEVTGER